MKPPDGWPLVAVFTEVLRAPRNTHAGRKTQHLVTCMNLGEPRATLPSEESRLPSLAGESTGGQGW